MAIDPRSLSIFLAVCRQGSISAAARELAMSQPSVSVTIAQLERKLGTRLFERGRSGITLERAGVAMMRRAEAMESLLQSAQREIDLIQSDVSGPLVVGGTPGALASLAPRAISRLKDRHPRFELRILERSDSVLLDLLRNERIDLAIATTRIEAVPADIVEETILQDPFDLIVGRRNDHLPARVALSQLTGVPWVLPEAVGAFRRQIDALFVSTQTPTPHDVVRCDSLLTTKAIVRGSDYVTILPREVASAELSIGVLRAIKIDGADFLRNIGVRRLAGRELTPIAEAFLTAIRQYPDP